MKVAVIWLWNHWKKYINFFERQKIELFWSCKSVKTKNYIEETYDISVDLNYKDLIKSNVFDFIVLALPSDIQWQIAIEIVKCVPKTTNILIELPVSDFKYERKILEWFDNIWFFVEEYYSLLAKFLRKSDIKKIKKIDVRMYVSEDDFWDKKSENIDKIHLMNNFIWLWIDYNIFDIKFFKHDDLNVCFDIKFIYAWREIKYSFFKEKIFQIWNRNFIDSFNFDEVVNNIMIDFSSVSNSKKDFNRIFNEVTK